MATTKRVSFITVSVLLVVAIFGIEYAESVTITNHAAAAPAVDCSTLILNMADCLSFVTNGSTSATPEGACCAGLKTVLKVDSWCLCEAFRTSTQLGVFLNVTKALSLPHACKVSAPEATNCAYTAETPADAPGPSSESSPTAGGSIAPPPSTAATDDEVPSTSSPAGSSGSGSGSSSLSVSARLVAIGLGIVYFISF